MVPIPYWPVKDTRKGTRIFRRRGSDAEELLSWPATERGGRAEEEHRYQQDRRQEGVPLVGERRFESQNVVRHLDDLPTATITFLAIRPVWPYYRPGHRLVVDRAAMVKKEEGLR